MLLYKQHDLVHDRRAIIIVPVPRGRAMDAAHWHCTARRHGVLNVIFATADPGTQRLLLQLSLPTLAVPNAGRLEGGASVLLDLVTQAVAQGYNVLYCSLDYIIVRHLQSFVEVGEKADILRGAPPSKMLDLVFIKSRARTQRFWARFVTRLQEAMRHDFAAPGSWKELVMVNDVFEALVQQSDRKTGPMFGRFRQGMVVSAREAQLIPRQADALASGTDWLDEARIDAGDLGERTQEPQFPTSRKTANELRACVPLLDLPPSCNGSVIRHPGQREHRVG